MVARVEVRHGQAVLVDCTGQLIMAGEASFLVNSSGGVCDVRNTNTVTRWLNETPRADS